MKVRQGYTVKIADIGTPGIVVKVGANGQAAVVEFDFPEGKVQSTLPVTIISSILSRGKFHAQA